MSPAADKPAATRVRIKYTAEGFAQQTRSISKKEADDAGFDLPETLVWGPENRHTVTLDSLSDDAREFFDKDPDFKVSDAPPLDADKG